MHRPKAGFEFRTDGLVDISLGTDSAFGCQRVEWPSHSYGILGADRVSIFSLHSAPGGWLIGHFQL